MSSDVHQVVLQVGHTMPSLTESLRSSYDVVVLPDAEADRSLVLHQHGARVSVAVVSFGAPFSRELFEALPHLGAVVNFGVGYDNIDVAEAGRRGVMVSNTPDVLTDSVAELAVGLALAAVRRLPAADRYVRSGRWPTDGSYPLTRQLSGCRVGVLGLGRIGLAIARRLEAFGCPISYHNRRPVEDVGYAYAASPRDLAGAVDVLVVAVPGSGSTDAIVDRSVLEALGPDGVLVNVARGSVVDEVALVELLVDGELGGAGLDVFADEPQVPEMLLALDTVALSPHVGSGTGEARDAMAALVLDNVRRFFAEGTLVTPVTG